jgi:hypothetical protein
MSNANLVRPTSRGRAALMVVTGGCLVFLAGCGDKNPETFNLKSGEKIVRKIKFDAGTKVQIWVTSEHNSDVDLFVFDENGKSIVKDEGDDKDCHVVFTPETTQRFKIEVQNRVRGEPELKARNVDNRCTLKWEPKRE